MSRNDELLIETVRRYTHLYDQADKNYHDLIMTRNSWDAIGELLNSTGKNIIKKYLQYIFYKIKWL